MTSKTPQLSLHDTETSLDVIESVFRRFRPALLEQAGRVTHSDKQDGTPVTDMDPLIEETVTRDLAAHRPNIPVFGEETGYVDDIGALPPTFWLIDPLDGTQSFIDGSPSFTNMAVLIQDGRAAACIIYNPSSDDCYRAYDGGGAFRNGRRLDLAAASLPGMAFCKQHFVKPLTELLKPYGVQCQNGPNGGGYGFSLVADGRSAARFNLLGGGQIHDYAPGALLVREAGGILIPLNDRPYRYDSRSFIACHPAVAPLLEQSADMISQLELDAKP